MNWNPNVLTLGRTRKFANYLENLVARLDLTNLEFFLLGDMNADVASTNYDNNVRELINIADIYGLHQLISEPTRITEFNLYKLSCEGSLLWSRPYQY